MFFATIKGYRSNLCLPTTSCLSPDDAIESDVSVRAGLDLSDGGFVSAAKRAMVGLIIVVRRSDATTTC